MRCCLSAFWVPATQRLWKRGPVEPLLTLAPAQAVYRPLDEVTLLGAGEGRLLLLDGEGVAYFDKEVKLPAVFRPGGALGTHTVLLLDTDRKLIGRTSFLLDTHTEIREPSGEFQHLLDTLYWTMASDGPIGARRHDGRVYTYWVDWLLDNTTR